MNGDTLTDVNIGALFDAHRSLWRVVTMAVIPNTETEKYSGVAADAEGRFTGFVPRGSRDHRFTLQRAGSGASGVRIRAGKHTA